MSVDHENSLLKVLEDISTFCDPVFGRLVTYNPGNNVRVDYLTDMLYHLHGMDSWIVIYTDCHGSARGDIISDENESDNSKGD